MSLRQTHDPVIYNHAMRMDRMYRYQRYIYDLTRSCYLLGRDRLIRNLNVPRGGSVLEIGCGTGRNLEMSTRHYKGARFYGLDISEQMLRSASAKFTRTRSERVILAQGDAIEFDPVTCFGSSGFDRIYFSYVLSMIPEWKSALLHATTMLNPDGEIHIVDFGPADKFTHWSRSLLWAWLQKFGVQPRLELGAAKAPVALPSHLRWHYEQLFNSYAAYCVIRFQSTNIKQPPDGTDALAPKRCTLPGIY